jgi:hypothetical protein
VTEALWPLLRTPVLKLPLLAVAVWALGPLLCHTTVSPTCTVIVAGVKLKSAIVTVAVNALRALFSIERTSPASRVRRAL